MGTKPRLIAGLSLLSGQAVKTKSFESPRYLGDPINITQLFSRFEVDELAIFEISKRHCGDRTTMQVLEGILQSAFMPISLGGGITNFLEAKEAFSLGFDKVILKSALNNPVELSSIASVYGQQAVIGCLNIEKLNNRMIVNDQEMNAETLIEYAIQLVKHGVGELIIQDIKHDGTRSGYSMLQAASDVAKHLDIPVCIMGGVKDIDEAAKILKESDLSGVVASSMFVYHPTRDSVFVNYPKREIWTEKLAGN